MPSMTDNPFKKSLAQKQAEASEGFASYKAGEDAARANMLRLRAERLAREALNPPEVAAKPNPKKKVRR
jgi:hypothetical protein